MNRFLATLVAVVAISGLGNGVASAKQCRDAAGKFTKCAAPKTTVKQCRDASGKFTKCPKKKM
jgi:hypothetical protein